LYQSLPTGRKQSIHPEPEGGFVAGLCEFDHLAQNGVAIAIQQRLHHDCGVVAAARRSALAVLIARLKRFACSSSNTHSR
jgi:hypothetical protein